MCKLICRFNQWIAIADLATRRKMMGVLLGALLVPALSAWGQTPPTGRTTNIALTQNDQQLIVVNPENDSITVFKKQKNGNLQKRAEISVGREPSCVAIHRKGHEAYVTNSQSGTVSVVALQGDNIFKTVATIPVGTEPGGCALSPNGKLLFVANFTAGTVSVIRTGSRAVVNTVQLPGNPSPNPAAIAVTNDGDGSDNDETVFVTQFFAELRPDPDGSGPLSGGLEGFDDGKQGVVFAFPVNNTSAISRITLAPIADSGFTANRSNLCKKLNALAVNDTFCPDPTATTANDAILNDPQGAFPNQFHAALIRGNRLYLPNIGAQPEPPVQFRVNIQALVNVVDTEALSEKTELVAKLNDQIKTENGGNPPSPQAGSLVRLFANDIVAIDANRAGNDFLIVSRGGNAVIRAKGSSSSPLNLQAPNVVRFQTGNIPTGVAISKDGRRAYVNNEINCSVSILDLQNNRVIDRDIDACTPPDPGSHAYKARLGKLVFFTALGVPDNGLAGTPLRNIEPIQFRGKQSDNGWSTCASCHPKGLSDHVTWIFGDGPRQTLPLDALYSKINGAHDTRINNWSAARDSVTDFNQNSRGVQGGCGFASDDFDPGQCTTKGPATLANPEIFDHGVSQDGSEALDLETLWAQTVRPLNQPPAAAGVASTGRTVFQDNCASCHGGAKWTKSQVLYLNNPTLDKAAAAGGTARDPGLTITLNQAVSYADARVDTGTLTFLEDVGTFDTANPIEIRQNGQTPLGTLGFNVPALLGVNANAPYFHNGSAQTLEAVFAVHTLPGGGLIQDLPNAGALLSFLKSIDGRTEIFVSDGDIFKDPTQNLP